MLDHATLISRAGASIRGTAPVPPTRVADPTVVRHPTMSPNDRSGAQDPPTDADEFGERLAQLLSAAAANGVDVRGGWVCRSEEPGCPDSEVVIVELAPESERGSERRTER